MSCFLMLKFVVCKIEKIRERAWPEQLGWAKSVPSHRLGVGGGGGGGGGGIYNLWSVSVIIIKCVCRHRFLLLANKIE